MARLRELAEQVRAELPRREVILDGEIVAIDDEGWINFWDVMRGRGTLAYVASDVLWLNGRDLRGLWLTQRKKRLERLIPETVAALNRMPCFEEDGCELLGLRAASILRASWRSGKRTATVPGLHGTRLRIQLTLKLRAEESCSSAAD